MIKSRLDKSMTLLELIISIAIMSIIVLGFTSLDLYSRHNVLQADRRARVQNTLSYALDHMTKKIGNAIGDSNYPPVDTTTTNIIKVRIDSNNDGKRDVPPDIQIAYVYKPAPDYQIWYYSDFATYPSSGYEVIAKNITSNFTDSYVTKDTNYINITIKGCWDITKSLPSQDNPENTMLTRIKMWGVSTN